MFDTLASVGFWMIIGGLVAEAIVIVAVPSGKREKTLSVIFLLTIDAGVWLEHAANSVLQAEHEKLLVSRLVDRELTPAQREDIAAQLRPFSNRPNRQKITLVQIENDSEVAKLTGQIEVALRAADWQFQT